MIEGFIGPSLYCTLAWFCILQIARIGDIYKVNNTSRPGPNSSAGGNLIDWEIITETGKA
jgi:hypothetical protein